MVVMASLLGSQELKVSITTDSSVSVEDDRPGTSPWCAS